jgi:hypothetical protein
VAHSSVSTSRRGSARTTAPATRCALGCFRHLAARGNRSRGHRSRGRRRRRSKFAWTILRPQRRLQGGHSTDRGVGEAVVPAPSAVRYQRVRIREANCKRNSHIANAGQPTWRVERRGLRPRLRRTSRSMRCYGQSRADNDCHRVGASDPADQFRPGETRRSCYFVSRALAASSRSRDHGPRSKYTTPNDSSSGEPFQ